MKFYEGLNNSGTGYAVPGLTVRVRGRGVMSDKASIRRLARCYTDVGCVPMLNVATTAQAAHGEESRHSPVKTRVAQKSTQNCVDPKAMR